VVVPLLGLLVHLIALSEDFVFTPVVAVVGCYEAACPVQVTTILTLGVSASG
jgi:hypothetical protein